MHGLRTYLEEVGALLIVTYTPAVSKCGNNIIEWCVLSSKRGSSSRNSMQVGYVHRLETASLAPVAKNGKERSRAVKGIYAKATSTTLTWFKLVFAHIYNQPRGWWNEMKCKGLIALMGVKWECEVTFLLGKKSWQGEKKIFDWWRTWLRTQSNLLHFLCWLSRVPKCPDLATCLPRSSVRDASELPFPEADIYSSLVLFPKAKY